jgi:hypothetical protein
MYLISFKEYVAAQTIDESFDFRSVKSSFRHMDAALIVDLGFHRLIKNHVAEKIIFLFLNRINQKVFGNRSRNLLRVFPVLRKVGASIKGVSLVIEDPSTLRSQNYRQSIEDLLSSEWDEADRLTKNPSKSSKHNRWLKMADSPDRAVMDLWRDIHYKKDDVLWSLVQM